MRPRFLIIMLGIGVLLIALILFFGNRKTAQSAFSPRQIVGEERHSQVSTNSGSVKQVLQTPQTAQPIPADVLEFVRKTRLDPSYEWKQPINFYGRIIDQSNSPVADAGVHFLWNDISKTGTSEANTKSDGNGFFSLTDRKGKGMTVTVGKDGYYGTSANFEYANPANGGLYIADPNNPVVFHLRKKGVGVDLMTSDHGINSDLHFAPPTNGVPVFIDFFNRQVGDNGQLKIEGWKEPKDFSTTENNWGFRLTVPDGGLIEENDAFPFEAPDTDYQTVTEWHFTDADPDWKGYLKKSFYIKFGNPPHYGIISVETTAFAPGVYLRYIFNPDGSRDLEPK